MGSRDPRIDAYIAKSADFAKPILNHIRELVHAACPEVEETTKWGMPHFVHKGILCSMASFKSHCTFGFWKGSMLQINEGDIKSDDAMGQFGRITAISDLPKEELLVKYIQEAARLNEAGVKRPVRSIPKDKKELKVPTYILDALQKNEKALATFESFNYSNKKEYLEWITEAKTESKRQERLKTAIEWMAESKVRNWKYLKK